MKLFKHLLMMALVIFIAASCSDDDDEPDVNAPVVELTTPESGDGAAFGGDLLITGTVTDDTASAVKQLQAGRVEFRMDRNGNVSVPFGKRSFEKQALVENAQAVFDALNGAKPASAKGTYIKRVTISSTMGPGLRVSLKEISA